MENTNNFRGRSNLYKTEKNTYEVYHSNNPFYGSYEGIHPSRRLYNCFPSTDEPNRLEPSMFHEEFSDRMIPNYAQKNDFKFEYNPFQFKDLEDNFEEPYNFNLEFCVPEMANSYPKEELTSFDLTSPNNFHSADYLFEKENNIDHQKVETHQEALGVAKKPKPDFENIPDFKISAQNILLKKEEKKSMRSISPKSVDSTKLQRLMQCLSRSKGVNKSQIDEDIVARTVEFGQQKVAEALNIPYRRYKSILNKVGIKTSAGRKVNNFRLETELVDWAASIKASGKVLTRKMIKDKAAALIKALIKDGEISLRKVRLSKGWLDKFVKRHEEIKEYLTSQKGKKGKN